MTAESAPIASQALEQDRVIEVSENLRSPAIQPVSVAAPPSSWSLDQGV